MRYVYCELGSIISSTLGWMIICGRKLNTGKNKLNLKMYRIKIIVKVNDTSCNAKA